MSSKWLHYNLQAFNNTKIIFAAFMTVDKFGYLVLGFLSVLFLNYTFQLNSPVLKVKKPDVLPQPSQYSLKVEFLFI